MADSLERQLPAILSFPVSPLPTSSPIQGGVYVLSLESGLACALLWLTEMMFYDFWIQALWGLAASVSSLLKGSQHAERLTSLRPLYCEEAQASLFKGAWKHWTSAWSLPGLSGSALLPAECSLVSKPNIGKRHENYTDWLNIKPSGIHSLLLASEPGDQP